MLWLASELTHMLLFLRTLQNAGDLTVSGISDCRGLITGSQPEAQRLGYKHVTADEHRDGLSSRTPAEA